MTQKSRHEIWRKSARGKQFLRAWRKQWRKTKAGIASRKRERQSEANKLRQKRYRQSEKGRAATSRVNLKRKEAKKKWSKNHPEVQRAICVRRRARLKHQSVITGEKAIRKIYARAVELKQWFDVVVDHIIPLSRGGSHSPDNLQIIYRQENCIKSARMDYTPQIIFS